LGLSSAGLTGLVLFCGCQSTAESDLIARDRRMQEDKIYALQDYLAEYQQLVCQYRAENEALKEQLQQTGREVAPRATPPAPPERPRQELHDVEIPNLTVPRLDSQSSEENRYESTPPTVDGNPAIRLATHTEDPTPAPAETLAAPEPAERVWLSGEVFANEAGGPRILVDVATLTASGQATSIQGPVSLMVLSPTDSGAPINLARWDVTASDARAAAIESPDPHAMRFRLELPPDVPTDRQVELWVRLLDKNGGKLLEKVALDLRGPGGFASVPFRSLPSTSDSPGDTSTAAIAGNVSPNVNFPSAGSSTVTINGLDGWTIARPGETATAKSAMSERSGVWRAATEPLPMVIATSGPAKPAPLKNQSANSASEDSKSATGSAKTEPAPPAPAPPRWSPERSLGEVASVADVNSPAAKSPPNPIAWSPTR
jgi:hypothetical protein